jgi:hypothetical protein
MQLHCYLIDALDQILAWDLSAESCPTAVTSQAGLMAGMSPDELGVSDLD